MHGIATFNTGLSGGLSGSRTTLTKTILSIVLCLAIIIPGNLTIGFVGESYDPAEDQDFQNAHVQDHSSDETCFDDPDNPVQSADVHYSGNRNGDDVMVLLINASNESAAILTSIVKANSTYKLTNEDANTTDPATWSDYHILIWANGVEDENASMESELRNYVLNGGCLLIEGANIAEHASSANFEDDVLHASSIDGIPSPANHYVGQNLTNIEPDHPVSSKPENLSEHMVFESNETNNTDSDVCQPENDGVVVFEWDNITTVGGGTSENSNNYGGVIAFDNDTDLSNGGQVIFISFGLELFDNHTQRDDLVGNSLNWLVPGNVDHYYEFHLSPDFQSANINSGGSKVYEIMVTNTGNQEDTIDLVRSAPPEGWDARLNVTSVDVGAGENTTVSLTVTAVTAQEGESANISVTGTSQGNPDLIDTVHTNTTVKNDARADLEPISLEPEGELMVLGEDTTINSRVRNNGDRDADNVVVNFYLDSNATGLIGTDTINVPAGQTRQATIDWNATDSLGDHYLIVDVEYNEPESDVTNNHLENATTDWVVRNIVSFADSSYNLTGNLEVEGLLRMDHVTLLLNSTDGEYILNCKTSGQIHADHSRFGVKENATDSSFRFEIRGELLMNYSTASYLYYNNDNENPVGGIVVLSSNVVIHNSTFTDSMIGIWTSLSPEIRDTHFFNLTKSGVYSNAGSPYIYQCTFENITTGISMIGGFGTIENCEIIDTNTGIRSSQSSKVTIRENTIYDLKDFGRGIFVHDSSPTISDNEIHDTATGIWIEEESVVNVTGNDLTDNQQYSLYLKESDAFLDDNDMSGNGNHGISINRGQVNLKNGTISNNANRGIYSYLGTVFVDRVTFVDNLEGIYAYNSEVHLINSTIQSWEMDLNITYSTILVSIHSFWNDTNVTRDAVLSVGWFLKVTVEDRLEKRVEGAEIWVTDNEHRSFFAGRTDDEGIVRFIPLITYNQTEDNTFEFTPHLIEVIFNTGGGNDSVSLTSSDEIEILINMPPTAVLESDPMEGSSSTIFYITGEHSTDDDYVKYYRFDFGDGEDTEWDLEDTVDHTYEYADFYTITLWVKDNEGAISEPDQIQIMVNNPPEVNLPETMEGKEGVEISFSADVFDRDSWDNLHYTWDFGDGETSNLISPNHAYDDRDKYTVILTVTDDHGGEGMDWMDVDIGENQPPVADAGEDFNVTYDNGATAYFDGSASYDDDGDELTYLWDFGDNTTSLQKKPTHFYNMSGTYNVSLTVEDTSGATDTVIIMVNVTKFRIEFPDEPTESGTRGEKTLVRLTIKNAGSHRFLINLTTTSSWFVFTIENITLDEDEEYMVSVYVSVPLNAPMGINALTYIAETGNEEFEGSFFIDVGREYGVTLSNPGIQDGDPGETIIVTLTLTNTGSDQDAFNVVTIDGPPGWVILLNGDTTAILSNVAEGGKANILISIQIPLGESGGEQRISIQASSVSDPTFSYDVNIRVQVSASGGDDKESDDMTLTYGAIFMVIITVVVIGVIFSKRKQSITFAEDEEEFDFNDSWDDSDEVQKSASGGAAKGSGRQGSGTKAGSKTRTKPGEEATEDAKPKPRMLKCPKCGTLLEVPSTKRPITIECPTCGARAHIKK